MSHVFIKQSDSSVSRLRKNWYRNISGIIFSIDFVELGLIFSIILDKVSIWSGSSDLLALCCFGFCLSSIDSSKRLIKCDLDWPLESKLPSTMGVLSSSVSLDSLVVLVFWFFDFFVFDPFGFL